MRAIGVVLNVVALALIQSGENQAIGEPITIVSPSAYADVEGDGGFTDSEPDGHYQQVLPASDFASLPAGYRKITQIAVRPDGDLDSPLTISFTNVLTRMSTTTVSPGSLSMTFAENIGVDDTVVFNGPLTGETANTGPPGGPKDFDEVVPLQTPFVYDPSAGNLLIDTIYHGMSSPQSFDGVSNPGPETHYLTTGNPDSPTADGELGGFVWQFTFVPEPSTLALLACGLLVLVGYAQRR